MFEVESWLMLKLQASFFTTDSRHDNHERCQSGPRCRAAIRTASERPVPVFQPVEEFFGISSGLQLRSLLAFGRELNAINRGI